MSKRPETFLYPAQSTCWASSSQTAQTFAAHCRRSILQNDEMLLRGAFVEAPRFRLCANEQWQYSSQQPAKTMPSALEVF